MSVTSHLSTRKMKFPTLQFSESKQQFKEADKERN